MSGVSWVMGSTGCPGFVGGWARMLAFVWECVVSCLQSCTFVQGTVLDQNACVIATHNCCIVQFLMSFELVCCEN